MARQEISEVIFTIIKNLKDPNSIERYKALSAVLLLVVIFQSISLSIGGKRKEGNCTEQEKPNESMIVMVVFRFFFWAVVLCGAEKSYRFWKAEFELFYKTKQTDKDNEFNGTEYFFYRLDYLYSRDDKFKPYALLTVTMFLILVGGLLWWVSTGDSLSESFWSAWTFVADPGTHADNTGLLPRLVSFIMTLGGMVIFAMVIGMITEDIGSFVDNLRKGRSRVIVSNHTLILGQGDMLVPIIQQLALANESMNGGSIVVLTETPKLELEEMINAAEINLYGSDVIVRTGVPHLQSDLKKVSAPSARSVIVLADKNASLDTDMADVNTVRTVLSLHGMGAPTNGHIVAEVLDVDNEQLVNIVGKDSVETFVSHDIIGRLMIQCARERGLAQVLEQLLGFEGCEFYIQQWPSMTGLSFGEVMYRFADAVVVGVMRGSGPKDAVLTMMNPPMDLVVLEGDQIIVVAEDDDSYEPAAECLYDDSSLEELVSDLRLPFHSRRKHPERLLFVGWRRDVEDMISELDSYVCKGSELTLFSQLDLQTRQERLKKGGRRNEYENLEIVHRCGNPTSRKDIELLPLEAYDSILILADEDYEANQSHDMMQADTRSLTALLLIRDIQQKRNVNTRVKGRLSIFDADFTSRRSEMEASRAKSPGGDTQRGGRSGSDGPSPQSEALNGYETDSESDQSSDEDVSLSKNKKKKKPRAAVISEILDVRTKPLISVASVTDYVTSNELLSMAIAMVSEQREVNNILRELLSSDGNEIYLLPIRKFLRRGAEASFFDIIGVAKSLNMLVIGYKIRESIVINPPDKNKKQKWSHHTELIIFAFDLE